MDMENVKSDEMQALNVDRKHQIIDGLNSVSNLKTIPVGEQPRAVRRQILTVSLANFGFMATGFGLGLPTVILKQLTDPNEPVHITKDQGSWYTSIYALSCPVGGLLCSLMLDRFGRKVTLFMLNLTAFCGWALMASAVYDNSEKVYLQLLVSRLFFGLSIGLGSSPPGVFAAEISPPKTRNYLVLGTSIAAAAGCTLMYILGYFIRSNWQLLAIFLCIYQVIAGFCLVLLPETPSWLLSKGRVEEAKRSLNYFRGFKKTESIVHPEVMEEFNILQNKIELDAIEEKTSFFKNLRFPEVYKPILILLSMFAFQQFSGIFVVVVYAVQIASEAGVTIDPVMCAIFVGGSRFITIFCMIPIHRKFGRRGAAILSGLGMTVSMFLLAAQYWWLWLRNVPYLPVLAIVTFSIMSTLGLYPLPFVLTPELLPQKARGPASGLAVACGMLMSFVAMKTYPEMREIIGSDMCFLSYSFVSLLAIAFAYFILPETRGRTLIEIEESFKKKPQDFKPKEFELKKLYVH